MNRNQKIALGCGGAGCLGLIVVAVAGILFYSFMARSSTTNRNYNFNSNSNSNANRSTNRNSNMNSAPSSSSSMSDDDKHKLFQAAGMTKDSALIQRALQKIGFMDASGTPTSGYEQFVKDHFAWALKNTQFVMSVNTEEKARAYVNEHLDN